MSATTPQNRFASLPVDDGELEYVSTIPNAGVAPVLNPAPRTPTPGPPAELNGVYSPPATLLPL